MLLGLREYRYLFYRLNYLVYILQQNKTFLLNLTLDNTKTRLKSLVDISIKL